MEHDLSRNDWRNIDVAEKGLDFWMTEAKRIAQSDHIEAVILVCRIHDLLIRANLITTQDFADAVIK